MDIIKITFSSEGHETVPVKSTDFFFMMRNKKKIKSSKSRARYKYTQGDCVLLCGAGGGTEGCD